MQIVHKITESSAQSGKLFNAAHVYSSLNRKMMAPVDNQGNAQLFGLSVQVLSDGACTTEFKTASNSYVTKQAVKSWYKVWRKNLKESGTSLKDLGPYGRVFKPRLYASDSSFGSGNEAGTGTWNYTDIVQTPARTGNNDVNGAHLADKYTLHLLGSSVTQITDPVRMYNSVGMIESWLGSRKKPTGSTDNQGGDSVPEELVFDQDNPLLLARGGSFASETMLDEIREMQKEEPPYTESDFSDAYTQAVVRSNADLAGHADIVAPCGLMRVTTSAAATVIFTLTGIGDM